MNDGNYRETSRINSIDFQNLLDIMKKNDKHDKLKNIQKENLALYDLDYNEIDINKKLEDQI